MNIRLPEHILRHYKHAIFMFAAFVMLLSTNINPVHAQHEVYLIAAKGSGIEMISNRDIRRIFLGLKSADSDRVNKPVINLSDRKVYEEFLKNIMHMTDGAYKRKIVKRIFRNGTEEIEELEMLDELNEHLISNVGDISFADHATVNKMRDIEVVKVLW
ncbi:MAG: hypothetical protein HKO86_07115 [Gammaproteobacteria bacterium]|nr:hypothetical protein [Gammaproteobacteria bacterium]